MLGEKVYKQAQTKLAGISGEQCRDEGVRRWSGKKKEKRKTGRRE
jgi:hypothetical protein